MAPIRPDKRITPNIDFHQKELAAYLARARGRARARCDSICGRGRPAKPRVSW